MCTGCLKTEHSSYSYDLTICFQPVQFCREKSGRTIFWLCWVSPRLLIWISMDVCDCIGVLTQSRSTNCLILCHYIIDNTIEDLCIGGHWFRNSHQSHQTVILTIQDRPLSSLIGGGLWVVTVKILILHCIEYSTYFHEQILYILN